MQTIIRLRTLAPRLKAGDILDPAQESIILHCVQRRKYSLKHSAQMPTEADGERYNVVTCVLSW